jgi:hypothetical protein
MKKTYIIYWNFDGRIVQNREKCTYEELKKHIHKTITEYKANIEYVEEIIESRARIDIDGKEPKTFIGPKSDKKSLLEMIEAIPRRIEPLGGQRFSYVKLAEVIDTIKDYYGVL